MTPKWSRVGLACSLAPLLVLLAALLMIRHSHQFQQQQPIPSDQSMLTQTATTGESSTATPPNKVLPTPDQRPNVRVNIREWTKRISDDIRLVSNRSSCTQKIAQFYQRDAAQFQRLDAAKLRDSILIQVNTLLSQHRAALGAIVQEAERAAAQHQFQKELRVQYTDVHRLRNELADTQDSTGSNVGDQFSVSSQGGGWQAAPAAGSPSTSISGGTPVPGPPEWQTTVRSIELRVNKNFGDIPVNTSMSAVHLPLPIYPGLPEIMNGIAWSEQLDDVFRKNLEQYAHVHHQYYGDHLGFMRTFPAHKWRIARTEPDLFDARTRPWYIAGAAMPKDVVILVDTSGSMTGLRREIAKGVVFELLDTLTISDYFAVMRFSESVTPVGLPRCAGLRRPRLAGQLESECLAMGGHSSMSLSNSAHAHMYQYQTQQQQPDNEPLANECANFRRSWEARGQYLRDHPNVVLGKNGSYITDDAYRRSLANVTNDIRDAYLLPASSRNIRYLKSNFSMPTAGIANFTHALMAAFELLQAYNRTNELGSQCQQAIVLITDGAIRAQEEVFNRYNYPGAPVRVFTYMIGREVGSIGPTKEMACRNRGYYAHVINLSEVREQVQKYLPVMARPLVLAQQHPVSWTNAYGDETHQVLTDWVLEVKRRERARIMLNEERERSAQELLNSDAVVNIDPLNLTEYDELPLVDELLRNRQLCEFDESAADEPKLDAELDPLGYNELGCHWSHGRRAELLTSVVKPVFDLKNTSLFFERILSKNVWHQRERHVRNAQLLGVAAVDLRISDILRAVPSHLLGPNGYAILMGQNGFIMHHPDHRALLEDPFDKQSKILKPYFNALDLTHIEQVYHRNETDPVRRRSDEAKLVNLRLAALKRALGSETLAVKRAVDCRRRPHVRQQHFYYGPIKDTPFSLLLALPKAYGLYRVQAKLPLTKSARAHFSPSDYDLLTVHPDYRYCERVGASGPSTQWQQSQRNKDQQQQPQPHSQDESLRTLFDLFHMVAENEQSVEQALELTDLQAIGEQTPGAGKKATRTGGQKNPNAKFICDRELFPSLLFDARATHEPAGGSALCCMSPLSSSSNQLDDTPSCQAAPEDFRSKLANSCGLEMSFLATRSGLTRTRVFDLSTRVKRLAAQFIERHSRAVDEAWYARTVDWNLRSSETQLSTLISVPYNAYVRLIAKLRQRLAQRQRSENDTRTVCDPSLLATDEPDGSDGAESADETAATQATSSTSERVAAAAAALVANEPSLGETKFESSSASSASPADAVDSAGSPSSTDSDSSTSSAVSTSPPQPKPNYAEFSTFDFLDLLTNSSVHVAATQTIVATNGADQRAPVGVTGHLYDYAAFARRFLNSTSLAIRTQEPAQQDSPVHKVQICPGSQCPTKCGLRTDTIDCLLLDNNGFIIVGEELAHVGRQLNDYDDRLMASLVERKVYQPVIMTDYQAICARNDQAEQAASKAAAAAASAGTMATTASPVAVAGAQVAAAQTSSAQTLSAVRAPVHFEPVARLVSNFARALVYTMGTLYSALFLRSAVSPDELLRSSDPNSLLGQLYQWQRSAIMAADAQSSSGASTTSAQQSQLALLPNKTYLRPCERQLTMYDMRPIASGERQPSGDTPTYYETKCGCSGWYVFDPVPETNLLMLVVNSSLACRRCEPPSPAGPTVPLAPLAPLAPPLLTPLIETGPPGAGVSQQQPSPTPPIQTSQWSQAPIASLRTAAEDQVCTMLERDAQLYSPRPASCLASHPDEAQILLCGGSARLERWLPWPVAFVSSIVILSYYVSKKSATAHQELQKQ